MTSKTAWIGRAAMVCAIAAAATTTGVMMGLFGGSRPEELGARDGRLAPCKRTPNCVSSQADADTDPGHYVAPIRFAGSAGAARASLRSVLLSMERVRLVSDEESYLYAEFSSRIMGFVDDVEFLIDAKAGVIHVRSASRLGRRDLGVNRARVEAIRSRFAAPAK